MHAVTAGFTFPTTLSSLLHAGFRVTVADTEQHGFGLDPTALLKALRPETRVICITHFLGFPANLAAIMAIAKSHNLLVLQDACETMNLVVEGQPAHQHGTLTTWSFYHPHHLTTYGGGAILSTNGDWQARLESLTHWGRACTCHYAPEHCPAPEGMDHFFSYVRTGFNLEMSELNACFGRFQLQQWTEHEQRRRRYYDLLYQATSDLPGIRVYPAPTGSGTPFVFPVTCLDRPLGGVASKLLAAGVEIRNLVGGVVTRHDAYAHLDHDGLESTTRMSERSFMVGMHQTLKASDIEEVAGILRAALAK